MSEFAKQWHTYSIVRNQRHFCTPTMKYQKQKLGGKNPIYYSNKTNKVPRKKPKQGDKRPVLGKLQQTEEGN